MILWEEDVFSIFWLVDWTQKIINFIAADYTETKTLGTTYQRKVHAYGHLVDLCYDYHKKACISIICPLSSMFPTLLSFLPGKVHTKDKAINQLP